MASSARQTSGAFVPSARRQSKTTPAGSATGFSLISDTKLKQLYSTMLQCRLLTRPTRPLRGNARLSGPSGREAAAVATCIDLRGEDWLVPSRRDVMVSLVKGAPLSAVLAEVHDRGATAMRPQQGYPQRNITPPVANAAAQLYMAAGLALTTKVKNKSGIVVAFCDDVCRHAAREALQFISGQCLPLLIITHRKSGGAAAGACFSAPDYAIAGKNHCAMPVIPVDAADVVAMYRVAYESIHKARNGGGPTLIETTDFQLTGAATGERRLQSADPLVRMEEYLMAKGLFSPDWKRGLMERFETTLRSAHHTAGR